MEQAQPQTTTKVVDVWSVKSQNQMNLVIEVNQESTGHSQISKAGLQSSNINNHIKMVDKSSTPITPSQQLVSIPIKNGNVIQKSFDGVKNDLQDQGFDQNRMNLHQSRHNNHTINNSHVPTKALDYLQLVDEPNLDKVVSQFSGHQFRNQFRNPLRSQTLFLSQVKRLGRAPNDDKKQNYMAQNNEQHLIKMAAGAAHNQNGMDVTLGEVHSTISGGSPTFKNGSDISPSSGMPRVSKTRNLQRATFFTSTSGHAKHGIQNKNRLSHNDWPNLNQKAGGIQISRQHPHTSQIQYRQKQQRSEPNRQAFQQKTFQNTQYPKQQSHNNDRVFHAEINASMGIAQDSIESIPGNIALKMGREANSYGFDREEKPNVSTFDAHESQPKTSDQVLYNIDRHTYQPFFKERRQQQDLRKQQLISSFQDGAGSVFYKSFHVGDSVQQNSVISQSGESQNMISSVIGSALKVRDIDSLKVRGRSKHNPISHEDEGDCEKLQDQHQQCPATIFCGSGDTQTYKAKPKRSDNFYSKHDKAQVGQEMVKQSKMKIKYPSKVKDVENPISVKVKVNDYENKRSQQAITEGQSTDNSPNKKSEALSPGNQSLRQSLSVSTKKQGLLKIPNQKKVSLNECPTTLVELQSQGKTIVEGMDTQMRESRDPTEQSKSTIGQIGGKALNLAPISVMEDGKQRPLISGAMTMKHVAQKDEGFHQSQKQRGIVSSNNTPKKESKPQTANTVFTRSYVPENLIKKSPSKNRVPGRIDTVYLPNHDIQEALKNSGNSQGTENEINVGAVLERDSLSSNNLITKHNTAEGMTFVKVPSAMVEVKHELNMKITQNTQSNNEVLLKDRAKSPDYEESLKQAGIISKKFIYQIENDQNDAKELEDKFSSQGTLQVGNDTQQNMHHEIFDTKDGENKEILLEQNVLNNVKNDYIAPSDSMVTYNSHQSTAGDYVITQYSLPKALTGFRNFKGNFNTQPGKPYQLENKIVQRVGKSFDGKAAGRKNQRNHEIEQFHYDRENKQSLVGMQGAKLSKQKAQMVKRNKGLLQSHQQRYIKSNQLQDNQLQYHGSLGFAQEMNDKQSQLSIITCREGKLMAIGACEIDKTEQIVQTIISQEDSVKNDLSNVLLVEERQLYKGSKSPISNKPHVPQLQLNKVELQFLGERDANSLSMQNGHQLGSKTPSYYGQLMTAQTNQTANINSSTLRSKSPRAQVFSVHQSYDQNYQKGSNLLKQAPIESSKHNNSSEIVNQSVKLSQPLIQSRVERPTRLISINMTSQRVENTSNVLTVGIKTPGIPNTKNKFNNISTQERSVKETLYHRQIIGKEIIKCENKSDNLVEHTDQASPCLNSNIMTNRRAIKENRKDSTKELQRSQNNNDNFMDSASNYLNIRADNVDHDLVNTEEIMATPAAGSQVLIDSKDLLNVGIISNLQVPNSTYELLSNDTIHKFNSSSHEYAKEFQSTRKTLEADQEQNIQTFRDDSKDNYYKEYSLKKLSQKKAVQNDKINSNCSIQKDKNSRSPKKYQQLKNKGSTGVYDTLALSSKEDSSRPVKLNQDLNIKVRTYAGPKDYKNLTLHQQQQIMSEKLTNSKQQKGDSQQQSQLQQRNFLQKNKQHSKSRVSNIQDKTKDGVIKDAQYQRDRLQILASNEEVNLEAIMKLRYSSDEDSQENIANKSKSITQKHKIDHSYDAVQSLAGKSALNTNIIEQQDTVHKLMSRTAKANNGFPTKEYVALKMTNMEPEGMESSTGRLSPKSSVIEAKTAQIMQVLFPQRQHREQQQQQQSSKILNSRHSQRAHNDSVCSQNSPKNQQQLQQFAQRTNTLMKVTQAIDTNWLEVFCQKSVTSEAADQNKRESKLARREKVLQISAQQYCTKKDVKRLMAKTQPTHKNRIHEVPQKIHSRAKIGNIGNDNTQIENIWAKNQLQKAGEKGTCSLSPKKNKEQ